MHGIPTWGYLYLDVRGGETAKNLSFKGEGTGWVKQQELFFSAHIMMAVLSGVVIGFSLKEMANSL